MSPQLINQLKQEIAQLHRQASALETIIINDANLPPPRLGPVSLALKKRPKKSTVASRYAAFRNGDPVSAATIG